MTSFYEQTVFQLYIYKNIIAICMASHGIPIIFSIKYNQQ